MADDYVLGCDPGEDPRRPGNTQRVVILQTPDVCCVVWEFGFTLISYLSLFVLETTGQAFEKIWTSSKQTHLADTWIAQDDMQNMGM